MVGILKPKKHADELAIAQAEAPELRRVKWTEGNLKILYFYAAVICVASATTGYDGSMLNAIQAMEQWQVSFGHPREADLGRLVAMYSIGSIASLPVAPFVSDRFGRKTAILAGCVIMIIAAAVQASSHNLPTFEGARFFMGFGNSLAQLASPLLLTEICHPQHRGRVTTVYNCLWNFGALVNSWIAFGTQGIPSEWSWRIPTLIQSFPSIIQLTFIWFAPESPRWLISKDRNEQALQILGKYHGAGDVNDPTVQFEYAEIKETIRLEFESKKTSSYLDLVKTKGNRYRSGVIIALGLFSQWSGNGLISYYTKYIYESVGITGQRTQLGLDGGNKVLSLFVSISCAFLVDKIGRRPLFLAATAGMFLFFLIDTILAWAYSNNPSNALGVAFVVVIWLHGISYSLAWSGLLVAYTVEILPFKLRAKGLMLMNFWVQVALTINSYVNPIPLNGAWHGSEWKLYAVYTAWIAFELVIVYLFFVETKGPTLEEIAKIFDGEDAQVAHVKGDGLGMGQESHFDEKTNVHASATEHRER